jgi:hypothetical protein
MVQYYSEQAVANTVAVTNAIGTPGMPAQKKKKRVPSQKKYFIDRHTHSKST